MTLEISKVTKIKKRDGRIVDFRQEKIDDAVWKSVRSVGGRDRSLTNRLASRVIEILNKNFSESKIPSVENIQDIVEKVLMEQGHSKMAKSYILYRQKRSEIREEKKQILEKEEIDEVDKQFDLNALRVLKARYLRKDGGQLIESPKELFMRVATAVVLPDLLYDQIVYEKNGGIDPHIHEEFNHEEYEDKFAIGKYRLNRYHLQSIKRLYDRMNNNGFMKVSWSRFLIILKTGNFNKYESVAEEFYNLMISKRFLPNTPVLANFGNPLGMGSACFVMDIKDSIESIMDTLKKAAIVFKSGGGMGYNFSNLRPEGDFVSSTSGIASGPLSFMKLFDTMTEVIKQGGIRRGANMGIMNINHPDIENFITAKKGNQSLRNFNISVLINPDFWKYYENNEPYPLINPRNGEVVREINPKMLFDMIVYQAWESAEPGLIFLDHANRDNPFADTLGLITCTNPCGEVLLYSNESCNLGSINVWELCKVDDRGEQFFDWDELRIAILSSVRFLDNVIDINDFPLIEIEEMTLATRKIGLGIMGLGDLLYDLGIQYNSDEGRKFMEELMEFINYHSKLASIEIAKTRGSFPYFDKSFYSEGRLPFSGANNKEDCFFNWNEITTSIREEGLRNSYTTVIAPTGSISMIAGCSSGIEPLYSLVYEKNVKIGSFYYVDPVFERDMIAEGLYDEDLIREVSERNGSIQRIVYISQKFKKIFVTSLDIPPEDHIKALASLQKWVDSSISKTINFPADSTVERMRESYLLAYKMGCKDITVFRDTSIKDQVLVSQKRRKEEKTNVLSVINNPSVEEKYSKNYYNPNNSEIKDMNYAIYDSSNSIQSKSLEEGCPICDSQIFFAEGCVNCPDCGWGLCS
jgi:ribonucleoside-diphosphate reductase alpha chain